MSVKSTKPCGCKCEIDQNDDSDDDAYETNHREANIVLCTRHKDEMKDLEEEESRAQRQLKSICVSLAEIDSRRKSLLKFDCSNCSY